MATALLIVIYISFIGMGVPDSIFGVAWPVMHVDFRLPVSAANAVSPLITIFTVFSALISARLVKRFGTAIVIAASVLMTALVLLGISFSNSFVWIILMSVPLGLGLGIIDTSINNYIALHYKTSHMNLLHAIGGIGTMLSPYLMSLALSNGNWRAGYRMSFAAQMCIALVAFLSLPLWRKVSKSRKAEIEAEAPMQLIPLFQQAKMPKVRMTWLTLFSCCAVEYLCGIWGSTYLVNSLNLSADHAAIFIMIFHCGMMLGRFVCGILAAKWKPWKIIRWGCVMQLAAILLLFTRSVYLAAVGLFFIGFGDGPMFPNLTHLTPQHFGREDSHSIIGSQTAAGNVGILLMPMIFGWTAELFSTDVFPWFLLVMTLIMFFAMFRLIKMLKKEGRYEV